MRRADSSPTAGSTRAKRRVGSAVKIGGLLLCAGALLPGLAANIAQAAQPPTQCPAAGAPAGTCTTTFTPAGAYTFAVPAGVTSVTIHAIGAAGGSTKNDSGCGAGGAGGAGASLSATFAVSGGGSLDVGVGAPGASVGCNYSTNGSSGGYGGGGSGGVGGYLDSGQAGAGGGGASEVAVVAPSAAFYSPLIVAGGGGGAGGYSHEEPYGDDGGAAAVAGSGEAGGAGSDSAGGSGGSGCTAPVDGAAGAAGIGGAGGGSAVDSNNSSGGGGGGGGGYFGGGGGGAGNDYELCGNDADTPGGGGGGGSNFFASGSSGQTTAAQPVTSAAMVSITYGVPTAVLSGPGVSGSGPFSFSFPSTQPLDTASTAEVLALTNAGSAPLVVSGIALSGTDPADYIVDNGCQQQVAVSGTCQVDLRFAPQATGASSATLTISTNAASGSDVVSLSGTGGQLPQGPPGTNGATGPRGSAGEVELVTCTTTTKIVKHRKKTEHTCTTKFVSGPVKFTTTIAERATLTRRGRVFATGTLNGGRLVLHAASALRAGRYTLTLTYRVGKRRHTSHKTITIN